ncbi:MAG: hypothetical protein EA342_15850 [Leptolyngbya sp. LCM1.Bin17]|nr:MAG: hypothetical protein EA342_15850 [Leptolyngbya sp. LCM1.Bin17]
MTITPEQPIFSMSTSRLNPLSQWLKKVLTIYHTYSPFSYRVDISWFGGIQIHPRYSDPID